MIDVPYPVVVEGRYDKNTLLQIINADVIETNGFSVFNDGELKALLRLMARRTKLIILTDSDGGGTQIRSLLHGILPKDSVIDLYIPQIKGKERRKEKPSGSGFLGVEGMDRATIEGLFAPFAGKAPEHACDYTKADLYGMGLSGGTGSAARRDAICEKAGLPKGMTPNAFLSAVNIAGIDLKKYI
ncbi:MAG: DUF4093 domain-containing protein [Clostridia bacterium]|nr:DUF4093 domain-containing protein [Clostridia bacterium]